MSTKSADDIRFDECLREVEERMQWLQEMRDAGQGEKYEALIKAQCSGFIREMKEIDKRKENGLKK